MEIKIELHDSISATVTIDGRSLKYRGRPHSMGSIWSYEDSITREEMETTIGGLIAGKIADILPNILQHHIQTNPVTDCCYETWDTLREEIADELYEELG